MVFLPAFILAASAAATSESIFSDSFEQPLDLSCHSPMSAGDRTVARRTSSDLTYSANPHLGTRYGANVTEWDWLWGFANPTDATPRPWPGINGAGPVLEDFLSSYYVAAHFHTPADASGYWGYFIYSTSYGGPNIDLNISRGCGDFAENDANLACSVSDHAPDNNPMALWFVGQRNPDRYCNLEPDTDYYVNLRYTRPVEAGQCWSGICRVYMTLTFGHL